MVAEFVRAEPGRALKRENSGDVELGSPIGKGQPSYTLTVKY